MTSSVEQGEDGYGMELRYHSPAGIRPPFGRYSHVVEAIGASRLVFVSGQLGMRPDGTVPEVLAVTTDQRDLITPDGVEIVALPSDTSVNYEVYTDATQYRLLLFGPNGTRARVDSEGDLDVEHVPYANW